MTSRFKLSIAAIALIAAPASAKVYYNIYLEGPTLETLVVKVDTTEMAKNGVLQTTPFTATLKRSNGSTAAQQQVAMGRLNAGQVYEWRKTHHVAGARFVSAPQLAWAALAAGGKADDGTGHEIGQTTVTLNPAGVVVPPPPSAAIISHCQNYTQIAIQQFNNAQNRHCGFSGSRWSSDYQWHYKWCVAVSASASNAETQARANMLAQCH